MKRTLSALAIALASLLAAGTARAQTALEEIEATACSQPTTTAPTPCPTLHRRPTP